ncbi:MAG TPA: hypothetical protein VK750_00600 [Cytophagaceae bacterium]|jgi:hypothetical protein|nr:hypothetical protein [Cytophagaceae bacterium]
MFRATVLYIFFFIPCFVLPISAQDTSSITIDSSEAFPIEDETLLKEQDQYIYDTIEGKALDSTTWKKLARELNYGDTLATEKKEKKIEKSLDFHPNFRINSTLTKYILFTVVIVTLLYLLYRLIGAAVLSANTRIPKNEATFEILHDDEQMMQKNLNSLLEEALQKQDFKSAIRILFIQSLQELQSAQQISWKKEKTNRIYLHELINRPNFVPFSTMVLLYEKAWYSEVTTSKEDLDTFYTFKHQLTKV